ncbi:hypothetical protein [Streptomyces sp. NPDC019539]
MIDASTSVVPRDTACPGSHEGARLRAVELYGTKVLPMVRDILAG